MEEKEESERKEKEQYERKQKMSLIFAISLLYAWSKLAVNIWVNTLWSAFGHVRHVISSLLVRHTRK